MKHEVVILGGHTIDQKLRVWQVGAQVSKFGFYKLIECIFQIVCHGVKQNAKICAIGETECNKFWSLYLRRTKNWSEKKEGMAERE